MHKTNYSQIAKKYDEDESRSQPDLDKLLGNIVKAYEKTGIIRVLDLGCGTGNYLKTQTKCFEDQPIEWYGIDPSEEMLSIAQTKAPKVKFIEATAEDIPFNSDFFDLIVNNFAFHHFTDKEAALEEITRVLKVGGYLKIWNIDPYGMQNWWIYRYFPECFQIDKERFWQKERLTGWLENNNFRVKCREKIMTNEKDIRKVIKDAKDRTISQFDILDDREYKEGLKRIESDISENKQKVPDECVLLTIVGTKKQ
ncbi:MAG: class I SAM-dependent methyltransferase [Methanophagales archaeon]|nr:class I SAM-dependent methyltransferase [Methanophagales archaeon]